MVSILAKLVESNTKGRPAVLCTVVRSQGSTPRKLGTRMIFFADGVQEGSIGGGALEHRVTREASSVLAEGRPRLLEIDLDSDLKMGCGGGVWVLMEPFSPAPRFLILGGGHIAVELADMASRCGFLVWVMDGREGFASKDRFPSAEMVLERLDPETLLEDALLTDARRPFTYVAVITHDHELDHKLMLKLASLSDLPFLGMIGSRSKVMRMHEVLEKADVPEESRKRIRAPLGLPIGGRTPAEIALSITAELQAVRTGSPLAVRPEPSASSPRIEKK